MPAAPNCRSRVLCVLAVAFAVLLTTPIGSSADDVFLANRDFPTLLYRVDLAANQATLLMELASGPNVHAIAACPGENSLLTIARDNRNVARIDLGADPPTETVLGALPAGLRAVQMGCSVGGTVFFTDTVTDSLYTLDVATCSPSPCDPVLIGAIETSPGAADVNIQGADLQLAASGQLYLLTNGTGVPADRLLYRVDLSGGLPCAGLSCSATLIGNVATGDNNPGLVALTDGRLILSSNDDHMYEIDPGDASLVDLGTLVDADTMDPIDIRNGDLASRSAVCPPTFAFQLDAQGNPLVPGQIVDDEFAGYGVTVITTDPVNHPVMIFDSGAPTGGADDLGTPNFLYGGPGIGYGGTPNHVGRNGLPRGNVLIISADGNSADPRDFEEGGVITFLFDPPVPQVTEVHILDADRLEKCGSVKAYDAAGQLILSRPILGIGSNSFQVVPVGAFNVARLDIHLCGSGAITGIIFCAPCAAVLGDEFIGPTAARSDR